MSEPPDELYRSYLLRCWRLRPADADGAPVWRFELREVAAEPEKLGFSDLAELTAHLAAELLGGIDGEAAE